MKNIGYIISNHKVKNILDGIKIINNIDKLPKGYPYLLIGLNEAKKNISNFNILNHRIDELGYWTFDKTERRNDYEKDLNLFYEKIVNNIINKIKYYYINILTIKYSKFKILLGIINSSQKKYIYISNDMIYIYVNNYILGISLKIIKYCGISENKIISFLTKNENNFVFKEDTFLSIRMRRILNNNKYLIPYFVSLQIDK